MEGLSSTYRQLFDSHTDVSVEWNPSTVTSQLIKSYEMCRESTEVSLLWLSLIRRLFTPDATVPDGDPASSKGARDNSPRSEFFETIRSNLLQTKSFIPFVVSSFACGDQLVCYLATKVLLLVIGASRYIKKEWLDQLSVFCFSSDHECLYSISLFKHLLKSLRKAKTFKEDSELLLHSFIYSHWKTLSTQLPSRLQEGGSTSKWPELNFTAHLSLTAELLQHPSQHRDSPDGSPVVMETLEAITETVAKKCSSLSTLKDLLKIYSVVVRNLSRLVCVSERDKVMGQLSRCLRKLLAADSLALRAVSSVTDQDRVGGGGDVLHANLSRSVVRRMVVLIMKYACLLEDKADCVHFEATLKDFSSLCNFSPLLSNLSATRHALFCLLSEQDGAILDVLSCSCQLWKKRDLWQTHPTLHFCFSATHLHLLMLQFLSSVSYDHSILLDFLVSPETQTFHHLLVEYLEVCLSDWCALVDACEDVGEGRECGVSQGSVIEHDAAECDVKECASEVAPAGVSPTCLTSEPCSTEDEELQYSESTLDKVMDCFTRLQYALDRLSSRQLLPYLVDRLLTCLNQLEHLYDTSSDL